MIIDNHVLNWEILNKKSGDFQSKNYYYFFTNQKKKGLRLILTDKQTKKKYCTIILYIQYGRKEKWNEYWFSLLFWLFLSKCMCDTHTRTHQLLTKIENKGTKINVENESELRVNEWIEWMD